MTDHRQLAVDFFNHTWTLLDEQNRTPEQDKEMVHVAHASRYHWSIAGTVKNHARGDWQLARVYAAVGRFDESERYATYYLEACEESGFDDWDLPFAYEGLARACVQTNKHKSLEFLNEARKQGELIAKDDDKQWLMTNLDEIAAMLDGE